jgi:hypothetical protein
VTEPKGRWANDIAADALGFFHRLREVLGDLKECLVRAKVFFALIAWQFQCDHGDRQAHCFSKAPGIILDQFCRARRTNDDRFWLETVIGILASVFEQASRIGTQITRLKRGVRYRRAMIAAFDHGE